MVACATDGSFYHSYDLSIYCHGSFYKSVDKVDSSNSVYFIYVAGHNKIQTMVNTNLEYRHKLIV